MIKKFLNFQKALSFSSSKISNYKILLGFVVLIIMSVLINFNARLYEKNVWLDNPLVFTAEEKPLIRAGDPAYFINIAIYLKKNIPIKEYYNKLDFPYKTNRTDAPLLSHLIAYLAKDPNLEEIIKAGNNLVFISSIFTTIGICFLFLVIGRPFEGLVASLGTGISYFYFLRSSYGYIDTDILNLFFMYFLFAIIYLASKKQTWVNTLFYTIFASLIAKVFYLWYPKPELILISFFSLFFFTFINTRDWKKIGIISLVYILLTNPILYTDTLSILINNPYISGYLSANVQSIDLINNSSLNFNNIFRFIGEQQKLSIIELFKVEGSIYLGIACFVGLALWGITYPLIFIGLAPLSLFFLLSIILGQRAIFYSLPFMWFGFGYFINFIIFKIIKFRNLEINKYYVYFITTLCLMIFAILLTKTFTKDIRPPFILSNVTKAMIKMNDLVSDKNKSIMVAPWTYGYQSLMYNDIPIVTHGGMPTSPRHYFMARAFTSSDLNETTKILNYIVSGNVEKISEKKIDNFISLSKDLYNTPIPNNDIYFMLIQQQRLGMKALGAIAYWDLEENKPHEFNGRTAFDVFNILEINCDNLDTKTLTTKCSDEEGSLEKTIPVNLALGTLNYKPVIKKVVQITDGEVEINENYENQDADLVFQIVKNSQENTSSIYLMHEVVFNSSYNKLFHLNQSENFELIYDDYPNVKIYKINQ